MKHIGNLILFCFVLSWSYLQSLHWVRVWMSVEQTGWNIFLLFVSFVHFLLYFLNCTQTAKFSGSGACDWMLGDQWLSRSALAQTEADDQLCQHWPLLWSCLAHIRTLTRLLSSAQSFGRTYGMLAMGRGSKARGGGAWAIMAAPSGQCSQTTSLFIVW